jgi:hypothetical protein
MIVCYDKISHQCEPCFKHKNQLQHLSTLIGAGFSSHYVGDTADQTVQSFDLTGATGVRYLRMDIKSNWLGGGSLITSYTPVGLGEVAFDGTPVPEPGTLAVTGACLVGLLCRGRRKRA